MNWKKIYKLFILSLLSFQIGLTYISPANAQNTPTQNRPQTATQSVGGGGAEASIRDYLCTPTDASGPGNAAGDDLYGCINKLYRFTIAFSSVAAVFMIVIAGYLYMASDGNEESITKAKNILVSSITALIILFITFLLLREINPELVKFKIIQPPSLVSAPGATGLGGQYIGSGGRRTGGTGGGGGGSCTPSSNNLCSISAMGSACNWDSTEASKVCNLESGGGRDPGKPSGYDTCNTNGRPGGTAKLMADGRKMAFSYGLFQINLIAHGCASDMPGGANGPCCRLFTGSNYDCDIAQGNIARLDSCVSALAGGIGIKKACNLYRSRGWQPWENTANKCAVGAN